MKKTLVHASAFCLVAACCTALAAADPTSGNPGQIPNPLKGTNSLYDFFKNIVSVLLELGTIISVLGVMYGGFLYVTAQGNEEKLGQAQKTITWALVGTAILLGANTIMLAVQGTVTQLSTGVK